jgi:hypothetical protein
MQEFTNSKVLPESKKRFQIFMFFSVKKKSVIFPFQKALDTCLFIPYFRSVQIEFLIEIRTRECLRCLPLRGTANGISVGNLDTKVSRN